MSFTETYRRVFEETYGALPPDAGIPTYEVDEIRERLGRRLPTAVREFMELAGRFVPIVACHERILRPNEITIDQSKLLFAEENQAVVFWACDLDTDDPPVYIANNWEPLQWDADTARFSDFIVVFSMWQAINGGLPFTAITNHAPDNVVERCATHLHHIAHNRGLDFFRNGGRVAAAAPGFLQCGARTAHGLQELRSALMDGPWEDSTLMEL